MTVDALVPYLLVIVLAVASVIYGFLGLLGRDLYLPTRGGYAQHITGRSARIVGGVLVALGLVILWEIIT